MPGPSIEDFLDEPTHELSDWLWLWQGDHPFPVRRRRGLLGRLLAAAKRLLRPFVKAPLSDVWDRQRTFNLILISHLTWMGERLDHLARDLQEVARNLSRDIERVRSDLVRDVQNNHERLKHLESFKREGFDDVMRHSDALYALLDQKLDHYRREGRDLWSQLGALMARLEPGSAEPPARVWDELGYVDLERRFRGTETDIQGRAELYVPYLEGKGVVLDLGCGRGETLEVLRRHGIEARGVDGSGEMVRQCRDKGLEVEQGELFDRLAAVPEASLGGVLGLHVIEHLPPGSLDRLARLAWRALASPGVLVLETPNPLSMMVATRGFWLDPTHQRPVHPAALELCLEQAGFASWERLELRAFPDDERLPEIEAGDLAPELAELVHRINRLRDRLDGLLFGFQDYALLAFK